MNTRDLIELCQLDALGLLDENERDEFDAAFAAAGPAIQAQIRAEQARLVKTDWIPCEAEPPAALRETVLSEMSVAMRVADLRSRVLAAVHDEMAHRPVPQPTGALLHGPGRYPQVLPVRRVSRLWRASTLGFAAAAVAFGGSTLYLKGQYNELDRIGRDNAVIGEYVSVPGLPLRDVLFARGTRHRFFDPASPSVTAVASVFIDPEKNTGTLVVLNLPDLSARGMNYRVVALDDDGRPGQEIAHFSSNNSLKAQEIDIDLSQYKRLAIVEAPLGAVATAGTVILTSDSLT